MSHCTAFECKGTYPKDTYKNITNVMKKVIRYWLLPLLLVFYNYRLLVAQRWEIKGHLTTPLSKLIPHILQQKYEPIAGPDLHETLDELQNVLELVSKSVEKEKRTNEVVGTRDSSPNSSDEFEKHMNSVLQHVAKKLREIYITPRLGRDIEDNVECQRSRPPFAPRLGKKSGPLTPRLGRQAYEDRC